MSENSQLIELLSDIRDCKVCQSTLPHSPNPVVQASERSELLIIGQAPGIRVHESGIPWNDPSGDRLRNWLQMTKCDFYNPDKVAIMPMGFCFPGSGKSGDLPPRRECAPKWHQDLLDLMPNIRLTLLIGQYAQSYYLGKQMTLTERVSRWQDYLPKYIVLPHPSPRNNIWLKKNPWFERELLPHMQRTLTSFNLSAGQTNAGTPEEK